MLCPTDGETLVMADRAGVEIDYCPKCRGVWLDRGELDKIIERAAAAPVLLAPVAPVYQPEPGRAPAQAHTAPRRHDDDHDDDDDRRGRPYRKRESFLGNLFDF